MLAELGNAWFQIRLRVARWSSARDVAALGRTADGHKVVWSLLGGAKNERCDRVRPSRRWSQVR